MDLEITREEISDTCAVITAIGEFDVYTSPKAREWIVDEVAAGTHHLVVDVRRVDFLDSTGLGVLVGGLKRCRAPGGSMVLVVGSIRILKIFRVTGLSRVYRIFNEVPAALEAVTEALSPGEITFPGPHEYAGRRNSFYLRVYAASAEGSIRFRGRVLSFLADRGVESVFHLQETDAPAICEAVVAVAEPISQEEIIQNVRDDVDDHVRGARTRARVPASDQGDAMEQLFAAFAEAGQATIELGNAVIAYADGRLAARLLTSDQLFSVFHTHGCKLSTPGKLIDVLGKSRL